MENIDRSAIYTKVEKKSDSFLDLYERMKALTLTLEKEKEFEPHHRSPLAKTMTDNWHNRQKDNLTSTDISMNMIDSGKDGSIDNDNNSLTNSKVTDRAISITYKDKEKDELKRETSLIGIVHEEKKRKNINNIKDKEIIKKKNGKRDERNV